MRKILFLGMPGSGKGSQAELLIPRGFKQISTGDIMREAWKNKDPLVLPYKESVEKGELLPDEIIFKMLETEINNLKSVNGHKGYILDGAVRNINQAKVALEKKLFDEVLFFDVAEKIAQERLGNRTVCPNCKKIFIGNPGICDKCKTKVIVRKDDTPEAIKKRFVEDRKQTQPLIDFLKTKVKFHTVDGTPPIQEVDKNVLKILNLK
jgi:adenylate kinase